MSEILPEDINSEYKKIFNDNLEKLKIELTTQGEIILTTLVNDKAYQHIADTHLNNLHTTLTESYQEFLKNNSKEIDDINNKIINLQAEFNKKDESITHLNRFVILNSIITGCSLSIISLYAIYKLFK